MRRFPPVVVALVFGAGTGLAYGIIKVTTNSVGSTDAIWYVASWVGLMALVSAFLRGVAVYFPGEGKLAGYVLTLYALLLINNLNVATWNSLQVILGPLMVALAIGVDWLRQQSARSSARPRQPQPPRS